ncbi:hypothetical protein ebA561 [Aromatoleum aromaticum EbN1]|uniref:Uncharacterized protein n=1 Tax=Aromatoleum aromaticum (strain DSM 19018 / LMG 30748 / EbN1) TaxID=76114 RepID=Q5P8E6_AROAE|nr:hypothetical protein ebA561 [Aromatoleum aromaticum EbN1]
MPLAISLIFPSGTPLAHKLKRLSTAPTGYHVLIGDLLRIVVAHSYLRSLALMIPPCF